MNGIELKRIISFLKNKKIDFKFIGEKTDLINGFSTLFNYKEDTMTFVSTLNNFKQYKDDFKEKQIRLLICGLEETDYGKSVSTIKVESPKKIFFDVIEFISQEKKNSDGLVDHQDNNHAYISDKAVIGNNVKIGFGCVIESNVVIGDNTKLHHNVVIRNGTTIGKNCNILSGVIVGETGFNPLKNKDNTRTVIKHYGGVKIGDYVHIGDNCSISKGTIDDTIINCGVKINKQAILAHNVVVGTNTVFTSPVFVGGSVEIGKNCHIAATSIRNQCKIGDNAILGLGAVVVKDVEANTTVVGIPARPL